MKSVSNRAPDPTYEMAKINANPVWHLAFALSEIQNDHSPIGWGKYIFVAECLLDNFEITPKQNASMR